MACVTRHLLTAYHVSWACDPVLRVLAQVAEDVFVHLGAGWEVSLAHHALFESDSSHVVLVAPCLADLAVYHASGLAKQVVLERHVACIARKVLAGPAAGWLWLVVVLRRLRSLVCHPCCLYF